MGTYARIVFYIPRKCALCKSYMSQEVIIILTDFVSLQAEFTLFSGIDQIMASVQYGHNMFSLWE